MWLMAAGLKNELMEWGLGKAFPGWWDTCMVGVRSVVLRAQGFWARNLLWSWNHKDQKRRILAPKRASECSALM